jgi:hypothetical protein
MRVQRARRVKRSGRCSHHRVMHLAGGDAQIRAALVRVDLVERERREAPSGWTWASERGASAWSQKTRPRPLRPLDESHKGSRPTPRHSARGRLRFATLRATSALSGKGSRRFLVGRRSHHYRKCLRDRHICTTTPACCVRRGRETQNVRLITGGGERDLIATGCAVNRAEAFGTRALAARCAAEVGATIRVALE